MHETLLQTSPVIARRPDGTCCPPRPSESCPPGASDRRHRFWATQLTGCGTQADDCGDACGRLGLRLIDVRDLCCEPDCHHPCSVHARPVVGRTIDTGGWVHGLIANILLTDGTQPDTELGHLPGRRGGHWSETFASGVRIGSRVRQVPTNCSVNDAAALIEAAINDDLQPLVAAGVARAVEVEARYVGANRVSVTITITGPLGDTTRVGATGQRLTNAWAWGL